MPITLDATFLKHYKSYPLGLNKMYHVLADHFINPLTPDIVDMLKIDKFMRNVSACLSTSTDRKWVCQQLPDHMSMTVPIQINFMYYKRSRNTESAK